MKTTNQISIIGFGNQAKAWAMNLRDSGFQVYIGLRPNSPSIQLANQLKFKTFSIEEHVPTEIFVMLTPDDQHEIIIKTIYEKNQEKVCLYAHGHSMDRFNLYKKYPKIEHILLAPKSIASELRFRYETKQNLTAFYSLEYANDYDLNDIKKLAQSLGIKNIFPASFSEENEADMFSEQALLCSLLPYGILETYNKLIENGFSKELAFYECFYESKLIVDTLFKVGPKDFFNLISPNALIGSQVGKKLIFTENFQDSLDKLFTEIKNQSFKKTIETTNLVELRNQVSSYWEDQSLTHSYLKLKDTL